MGADGVVVVASSFAVVLIVVGNLLACSSLQAARRKFETKRDHTWVLKQNCRQDCEMQLIYLKL